MVDDFDDYEVRELFVRAPLHMASIATKHLACCVATVRGEKQQETVRSCGLEGGARWWGRGVYARVKHVDVTAVGLSTSPL